MWLTVGQKREARSHDLLSILMHIDSAKMVAQKKKFLGRPLGHEPPTGGVPELGTSPPN